MTKFHPLQDCEIHVFERIDPNGSGAGAVAQFHPYKKIPVLFSAETPAQAVAKAEAFRADAIAQHGDAYVKRQAALEKAREKRKAKA